MSAPIIPQQINSVAPDSTTAQLAAQVPLEEPREKDVHTLNSAGPNSTTAELAGQVPLENEKPLKDYTMSSAAPDSTTVKLAEKVPLEEPASEQPTPLPSSVPGFFPETPANEKDTFSVNPIPAGDTAENPIKLAPGEPVPKDVTSHTVTSNVTLDEASYNAADRGAFLGSLSLPDVVTPQEQRDREGRGVLDLPAIVKNMIPESSLPIVGGGSSTEHAKAEVPEIVTESQEKAHVPPEAAAVPESVEHKAAMETELKKEVSPAAAIGTGPTLTQRAQGAANTVTTTVQQADITSKAKAAVGTVTSTVTGVAASYGLTAGSKPADAVPDVVKDSQKEAGAPAEASAVAEVVAGKEEMENQLKQEVTPSKPIDASKTGIVLAASDKGVEKPAPIEKDEKIEAPKQEPMVPAPTTQDKPHVTNGTSTIATEPVTAAPAATESNGHGTATTTAAATKTNGKPAVVDDKAAKKEKRRSFLGRIKDKMHARKASKSNGVA